MTKQRYSEDDLRQLLAHLAERHSDGATTNTPTVRRRPGALLQTLIVAATVAGMIAVPTALFSDGSDTSLEATSSPTASLTTPGEQASASNIDLPSQRDVIERLRGRAFNLTPLPDTQETSVEEDEATQIGRGVRSFGLYRWELEGGEARTVWIIQRGTTSGDVPIEKTSGAKAVPVVFNSVVLVDAYTGTELRSIGWS